jgi:deoxyribodipyrimidine photolyase
MVVASFMQAFINRVAVGQAYFAEKLLDYEMSANVGIGNGQQVPVVMQLLFRVFNRNSTKEFDEKSLHP